MAEHNNNGAVYKVTVINGQGEPLIAYVSEASRQTYVRSMREEYGNAKGEKVETEDLPEGVSLNK